MQHTLAVKIANFLDGNSADETEEKLLLTFGIEVFLNEFLKAVAILALAAYMGVFPITCFSMIYLLSLRKYARGKHCNSNIKCYLVTFFTTLVVPIMMLNLQLPYFVTVLMIIAIAIAYFIRFSGTPDKKMTLYIIYFLGLYLGFLLGKIGYVNALLSVALVVVLAIDNKNQLA